METVTINGQTFQPKWIKQGADAEMTSFAEATAKSLSQLSKTQFRNIYGEIKRIQSNYESNKQSIPLLKPKVAYMYARAEVRMRKYIMNFKKVFDAAVDQVSDKASYDNFCSLMEAILAYHRYYIEENSNNKKTSAQ